MIFVNEIIDSIVSGFGVYCIVLFCFSAYKLQNVNRNIDAIDDIATLIVRIAGLWIVFSWVVYIYSALTADYSNRIESHILNRMFGPYWFTFWSRPVIYLFCTQLLWIKRIRKSIWIKLVIGILLILAWNIERFIIIITSYHRDFLPNSRMIYDPAFGILFKFIYDFAIFLVITLFFHFLWHKIKPVLNIR